ncbi:glycosyltransferase family 2 protein [Olleya sp. YS]|uniref:glycosyltransferase family 2 protein n=1 Tax=Olleya sp. YS TaxID=3028318 RepID=UPI002434364C|nr:glycosyltransferase family 2 protein [Olleya sp. YS]WGD35137.1 glycosyltransferase family 2 protein [Olleya sp. YS]
MLSVLIPTYNYDVTKLVSALHKQLIASTIAFEIIIFDDGSKTEIAKENQKLNTLNFVTFKVNPENVGLSNNRNLLANTASYNYILFIDGDSLVIDPDYISNYLEAITAETAIIYGGRIHPKQVSKQRKLRWKYGTHREDLTAKQREQNPYKRMFCNNTLMTKAIFNTIGFEKTLTQYGHEDTLFAYKASQLQTKVLHIDNPILHGDVDFSSVFLKKTKNGLQNLDYIYNSNLIDYHFIPFLVYFTKLKQWKLNYILAASYYLISPLIKLNLTSKRPSLFLFDLFRISYFCHINLKT